jgi:hypothetical protein
MEREYHGIPHLSVVEFRKIKTVKPLRSGDTIRYGIVYAVVPKEFIGKTAIVYVFVIKETSTPIIKVVP